MTWCITNGIIINIIITVEQQYMCYQFNLLSGINDNFTFDYIQNSLVSPGTYRLIDWVLREASFSDFTHKLFVLFEEEL